MVIYIDILRDSYKPTRETYDTKKEMYQMRNEITENLKKDGYVRTLWNNTNEKMRDEIWEKGDKRIRIYSGYIV